MSFLAIDIGNTRLKWALYPNAQQGALEQAGRDCRGLDSQERLLAEELEALQAPLQAAA